MSDDNARLLALYELVEALVRESSAVVKQARVDGKVAHEKMAASMNALTRQAKMKIDRIDSRVDEILKPQIEETRRAQQVIRAQRIKAVNRHALIVFGIVSVLSLGVMGVAAHYFAGQYGGYKTYWEKERASGFGFRVVTTEKGDFVVFDQEFELSDCIVDNRVVRYCASIKRR